jgi:hypothetical protein
MQLVAFSFSCKVPNHTIRWRIVSLNSELPLSGRVSQLWTALELEGWTHVKDTMLPLRNWVRSYGVEEDNQNIYEFESLPSIFPMIAWNECRVRHVLVFRTNVQALLFNTRWGVLVPLPGFFITKKKKKSNLRQVICSIRRQVSWCSEDISLIYF